jgi:hypothetical protein
MGFEKTSNDSYAYLSQRIRGLVVVKSPYCQGLFLGHVMGPYAELQSVIRDPVRWSSPIWNTVCDHSRGKENDTTDALTLNLPTRKTIPSDP